jgi:hypothetical protein
LNLGYSLQGDVAFEEADLQVSSRSQLSFVVVYFVPDAPIDQEYRAPFEGVLQEVVYH